MSDNHSFDLSLGLRGDISESFSNQMMANYETAVVALDILLRPYSKSLVVIPETQATRKMWGVQKSLQTYIDIRKDNVPKNNL